MSAPAPYRSTPLFDEVSLPAGLRREHRTKAGVWGLVRVLEGELTYADPPSVVLVTPSAPALLLPEQPHFVDPVGAVKMQVEFYSSLPSL